jgi:hypothetical protein
MKTYRFQPSPAFYWWNYRNVATFTTQAVVQSLAGAVVRSIVPAEYGGYAVDLQLDRDNHHDAVADIHAAMVQLSFNVARVVITEWATSIVEGALLGDGRWYRHGLCHQRPGRVFDRDRAWSADRSGGRLWRQLGKGDVPG